MTDNTRDQLLANILRIVDELEHPQTVDEDGQPIEETGAVWNEDADEWQDEDGDEIDTHEQSALEWLEDALDIEYRVSSRGEFLGGDVLVSFGGPNIGVDTRRGVVWGAWGSDRIERSFTDNIGLDDALSECFDMVKGA